MHQKLRLVLVALAAALALVGQAAAQGSPKAGGTLNVDLANDVDYTDPALSYLSTGWELEYATCLKLMNYPDANGARGSNLAAEAAAGFPRVSGNGKVYDFTVKAGFTRFSNGQPVTAATFKSVFDRLADPKLQSPAISFISDVVSVRTKGSHLVVTLKHAAPDFLARVAMPFFCAVPTSTPHDPNGVETPASAGPYYIASREANR
jgi:ABC-type transport system substrate-binding protein